jgi:PLP dependent protein
MENPIKENLDKINATLNKDVTLVAVSKTKPLALLQNAYDANQRVFGENKALEMRDKHQALPKDIEWHFIGHLQSNKVKYIAPFVHTIHSVDSPKILLEINKKAKANERIINVLLQLKVAQEESKFGFNKENLKTFLESEEFKALKNINITGVMGMATNTDNETQITTEFDLIKNTFDYLKSSFFTQKNDFKTISMGMSHDYKLAIHHGSNMVRIGSSIFGSRN